MSRFVPQKLLQMLQWPNYNTDRIITEIVNGALLVADISGFTKLNEEFSALGHEAIELVSSHVSQYFSKLLHLFESSGGDVIYFAGDALVVLFAAPRGYSKELGIGKATLNAIKCAFQCTISELASYRTDGFRMDLHLALSSGAMCAFVVGNASSKRAFLVSGQPFKDIGSILALSKKCDLVVTNSAWEAVSSYLESSGSPSIISSVCVADGEAFKILSVYDTEVPQALEKTDPNPAICPLLLPFLPRSVQSRIEENQLQFLGSLCNATIIFVSPQIDTANNDRRTHQTINEFYLQAVEIFERFEGIIRQFCVDDKGLTFIAAFSVPPLIHEDDPFRAVAAALDLLAVLQGKGIACKIGIASGKVCCGKVGSDDRHEFGIIGDTGNP